MFDVFEKRKLRRFFFSRTLAVALLGLFLFLAHASWGAYTTSATAYETRAEVEAEHQALAARKNALSKDIERLKTERGVEAELRSRFDVGHEGERLVILLDPPSTETPPERASWRERIRAWFTW